jgi:hypothetical protein
MRVHGATVAAAATECIATTAGTCGNDDWMAIWHMNDPKPSRAATAAAAESLTTAGIPTPYWRPHRRGWRAPGSTADLG